jgi:uncharacterized protein
MRIGNSAATATLAAAQTSRSDSAARFAQSGGTKHATATRSNCLPAEMNQAPFFSAASTLFTGSAEIASFVSNHLRTLGARCKSSTPFFSIASAHRDKNTRGGGYLPHVKLEVSNPDGPRRHPQLLLRQLCLGLLAVLFLVLPARAEKIDQLSPQGYVNDFAGAIDPASRQKLSALCQELDSMANAQLAIVTIHSLEGDTAQNFANRLFEKWGVGPKGKDRGVLILVAVDDHQYWTEVGYGLEPILPDGKVGAFGRQMLPLLRQNQYGPALLQIASQIAGVIAQDRGVTLDQQPAQPPPSPTGAGQPSIFGLPFILFGLIFFVMFILSRFSFIGPRRGRGYRGGGWAGPMVMGGMGGGWSGSGGGGFGGGGFGGFGGGASGGGGAGGGW